MEEIKFKIGGFVGINNGEIENSYSITKIKEKNKKTISGGFVAENSGTIKKSYSYGPISKISGGFVGSDTGHTEESCYFLHHEKEGSKTLEKITDNIRGQRLDEIQVNENVETLGFDITNIWRFRGDEIPMEFIPEKWIYNCEVEERVVITIENAEELILLAEAINAGDKEKQNAYIKLEEDINLGGKEWIPIGDNRLNAFSGIFDGQGHVIKNFVMKNKKRENKGFFGFLKGEVYNLSVDCKIKKGLYIGGIAAHNDGIIGACSAVVNINTKQGIVGGLVGRNTGKVFHSYAAGRVFLFVIPIWFRLKGGLPLIIAGMIIGGLILGGDIFKDDILSSFAEVPYDDDQVKIEGEVIAPNKDGNFVSFQFEKEIPVSIETGLCKFEFKNPGDSNHNIVVQMHFTDAQAERVMGSTGRSIEEQEKLESTPGYNKESYRTVIAESGSIRPGYQLQDLRLVEHVNGASLPPGKYNAVIYLMFYDIETNNRAMIESQLPVEIEVK